MLRHVHRGPQKRNLIVPWKRKRHAGARVAVFFLAYVVLDKLTYVFPARFGITPFNPEAAIAERKDTVAESGHRFIAAEVEEHVVLGDDGRWRARCSPAAAVTAWSEMAHAAPPIEEVRPVLILRAARDIYVREDTLLAPLREALGDDLEVVDIDSAHMIYWEQPEAAAAEVRRFLA